MPSHLVLAAPGSIDSRAACLAAAFSAALPSHQRYSALLRSQQQPFQPLHSQQRYSGGRTSQRLLSSQPQLFGCALPRRSGLGVLADALSQLREPRAASRCASAPAVGVLHVDAIAAVRRRQHLGVRAIDRSVGSNDAPSALGLRTGRSHGCRLSRCCCLLSRSPLSRLLLSGALLSRYATRRRRRRN